MERHGSRCLAQRMDGRQGDFRRIVTPRKFRADECTLDQQRELRGQNIGLRRIETLRNDIEA
jgi:hypothetical protein